MIDIKGIIEEMYREHCLRNKMPCKTLRDFEAEYKEDIYIELTLRTQ